MGNESRNHLKEIGQVESAAKTELSTENGENKAFSLEKRSFPRNNKFPASLYIALW